jgi:hypothetical protein
MNVKELNVKRTIHTIALGILIFGATGSISVFADDDYKDAAKAQKKADEADLKAAKAAAKANKKDNKAYHKEAKIEEKQEKKIDKELEHGK